MLHHRNKCSKYLPKILRDKQKEAPHDSSPNFISAVQKRWGEIPGLLSD
jgi:hypothetical protein